MCDEKCVCSECLEEVDFEDMSTTRPGMCIECQEHIDNDEAMEEDAYNHMPEECR